MVREPLRVLILEDDPADAELMAAELERAGYAPEWTRVETAGAFQEGLAAEPDLVLSDCRLPQFDGTRALALVRSQAAHIPLIILSGAISVEEAVACLLLGAADYVSKNEVARLGAAARNALEHARLRREHARDAARIGEANRLLYAMRGVHHLIVRERDAHRVLAGACEILDRVEGFGGTWIGRVDPGAARLVPAAGAVALAARMGDGAWGDADARSACPADRACATRQPAVCADLAGEPTCAATYAAVEALGFSAAAAVPILVGDALFGALTVFAARPEMLNREVVALLADVAADLGHAVLALDAERAREEAVRKLQASEEQRRAVEEQLRQALDLNDVVREFAPQPPAAAAPTAPAGAGAILLADDEPTLRRAGTRLLERAGYRVVGAADGVEALEVYLAQEAEIGLIVADVVMPRMSGPALLAELQGRGKSPRILFTSGCTERAGAEEHRLDPDARFIPKPWNSAKFLAAVREALNGPAA